VNGATGQRADVQAFLAAFFSTPNQLKPESKPEIPHWIARLNGAAPLPTVLPCWREGNVVDWYGIALDERELQALGESLTAFIGPSYTTFRGQIADLDPRDPIDKAVLDFSGGRAFKFRGHDPAEIWRSLERMRGIWERRGARQKEIPAPVGRVLRDFHMAIHAADRPGAEELLIRLKEQYHLNGVNVLYLRVQLLEAFFAWEELLSLPEIAELLRLRRPAPVTEALLRAVYQQYLAEFEPSGDPAGAADRFRRDISPRYGGLLAVSAGMHSVEAAKCFMLSALTEAPPDFSLRDSILAREDLPEADLQYLRNLARLLPREAAKSREGEPLALATKAVEACDFDGAFSYAQDAPQSLGRARLLCECAVELRTLAVKSAAINAVNGLSENDRSAFFGRRMNQQLFENLIAEQAAQAEAIPTDCCGWLEYLDQHNGRNGSREIARAGATEWTVGDFLSNPGAVERFINQLEGARSQEAESALRDCLPHIISFLAKDPAWPNPMLKDVYRALLELLVYSTEGGRADLAVLNELIEAVLAVGTSPAEYRELLSFAGEVWNRFASPATLDWAADALDLLIASPCPEVELRKSFLQAILDRAASFAGHATADQRELLLLAASDIGARDLARSYFSPEDMAAAVEGDVFAALDGMSVAVYTLTVRAAKQFRQVIEARAPGAKVSLINDLDGSKRLEQHARQADLFILTTASAKHAATNCVRAARPADKPLLIPAGKGAASMLAVVRKHLQSR
jgi:hypothetical protein